MRAKRDGKRERKRERESKRGQHARAGEDNRIGVTRFSCFALQCQEFPLAAAHTCQTGPI